VRGVKGQAWAAVLALALGLTPGCRRAKPKSPPAAAPSPGLVAVASAEPLSSPQTTARLPPPQPIPPEAIPAEPELPAAPPAAPRATRPKAAPRTRPPAAAPTPVSPAPPSVAAPPREGPGPQLRPLLTAEEERKLRRQIEQSLGRAARSLEKLRIPAADKDRLAAVERVRAFVEQAQQARRQGDLARAQSLAERAELLALDMASTSK